MNMYPDAATQVLTAGGERAISELVRLASRARMLSLIHRTAGHDFNDSLNSLTLNLELLARLSEDPAAPAEKKRDVQQRCIAAMRQELRRLTATTGRALAASVDRQEPAPRVHLSEVVDEVVTGLRHRAQRQGVTMRVEAPPSGMDTRGTPDELRLAVFNLVLNALEAMPQGGEIVVELRAESGETVVRVTDTGPGVPAAVEAKIWDLFFSTKPDALGLGLYVVRDAAARAGGTAALERRDSGVTFLMRLPQLL